MCTIRGSIGLNVLLWRPARKTDSNTLFHKLLHINICGLLRYLNRGMCSIKKILDETQFIVMGKFWTYIDRGLECDIRQTDPIYPENEDKSWQNDVLVKRTVNNYNTRWFLYSNKLFGKFHCEQFSVGDDVHGQYIPFLRKTSKTYKGGLGQITVQIKNLEHCSESGK
ncbi:hypothetical protein MHBO_004524 [Bonamia ostreae]|uniref:Uncharacterized protein n=1 Tax=Bonamia ostreae TaxID=126728 RepID=A0ABV2AU86_9EUKA